MNPGGDGWYLSTHGRMPDDSHDALRWASPIARLLVGVHGEAVAKNVSQTVADNRADAFTEDGATAKRSVGHQFVLPIPDTERDALG